MSGRGGRPSGRTIGGAIRAAAGVGGPMEESARRVLIDTLATHRHASNVAVAIGIALEIGPRGVRRMYALYGMTITSALRSLPDHPPQRWCKCATCVEAKAA